MILFQAVNLSQVQLEFGPLSDIRAEVHYIVGSVLLAVGLAGLLGNALVLFVFTR